MYLRERFGIYHSLLLITILLVGFGVVMVYSASGISSGEKMQDSFHFLKREIVWTIIGFSFLFLFSRFDYHRLRKISKPLLLFSILLLLLVFTPLGLRVNEAKRWLRIGPLTFQPSELAKLAIILYLADFLSRKRKQTEKFIRGFLPPLILLAPIVILILLGRDLGSTILISMLFLAILFVSGVKISYLVSLFLLGVPAVFFLIYSSAYRRARLLAFVHPWENSQGIGWQITQSFIALGSGGVLGKGLGQGRQKLFFLPEAHTDFIFSIIGEELGIFGVLFILSLFTLFIYQGRKIAKNSKDRFGHLLATGITLLIGFEAILHIGVTIGFFPTKGIPLPFVSYGGSSLLISLVAVGILLNISKQLEERI